MPLSLFFGRSTAASRTDQLRFVVYLLFLVLCAFGGGGSRADIVSLLYVRPGAILCLALILMIPGRIDLAPVKIPLWLLGALALWMIVQLIPLPPELWTSLPGRDLAAQGAQALGTAQPWRPLSLSPDLTLNSLASLVVPLTALIGFAAIDVDSRRRLLPILLLLTLASSLFSIAQISGGAGSPFYLYRITNTDAAVGLFANRNHQAALLAMTFPMLALWAAHATRDRRALQARSWMAGSFALFLVPMILVTGSRAGFLLGGLALIWSCFQFVKERAAEVGPRGTLGWKLAAAGLAAALGVGALFTYFAFSRAQTLLRLAHFQEVESRFENLPVFMRMIGDLFPFGSGFGSFDPVFRTYEPIASLSPRYLNQAHNDLVELAITGGLPALLLLLGFLGWWLVSSARVFRARGRPSRTAAYGRLGSAMILLLMLASLVDYPLRVPLMMTVFAIACGWLGQKRAVTDGSDGGADS